MTAVRLGDLVDVDVGFAFKSSGFVDAPHGVRLLRGDNVSLGRLRWQAPKYWPASELQGLERYALAPGDVVVAMDRPWIGGGLKQAVVRSDDVPALLVQRVARLRARPGLDQGFLAAVVASRGFEDHILAMITGSAVPHISGSQILSFPVHRLPAVQEQRRIAATLRSLDDKIESNRRLLTLSLELAAASVRSATADPSATHLPVAALARFVNGGAYTKGATGAGRMVVRIAEMNSGPGGSTVFTDLEVPEDKTARAGDLLMSWSGSLDVYRWTREEAIINQHIFKVIPKDLPAWLVHDRLKAVMPIFQSIAKDKATTMGHIQRGHLQSTTVAMPPSAEIKRLDAQLGPLWDRLLLAERQIHTLAALRDALLPELLSGRIRVPEAGESVESALA